MDTLRKILAVALKELQVFFKDFGNVFLIFLMPMLMAAINGSLYRSGTSEIDLPVALVNLDSGGYATQIVSILRDIQEIDLAEYPSLDEATAQVVAGDRLAVIFIPEDFTSRIDDYEQAEITVIIDPAQAQFAIILTAIIEELAGVVALQGEMSYGVKAVVKEMAIDPVANPNLAQAVAAQSQAVVGAQMQSMQQSPPITVLRKDAQGVAVRAPDNAFSVVMPSFSVMFAFFLMATIASDLLKEKEGGSLRRLLSSPLSRGAIIGGKIVAYTFLVMLQIGVIFTVGNLVFNMPLGTSFTALLVLTIATGLSATSLGMLIAAFARTRGQAGSTGVLLGFVLGGLGGCIQIGLKPVYRMEGLLGIVSRLTPHSHALDGFRLVMMENAGLTAVLPQVGILLGMALVYFVIAVWRFKFE